MAAADRRRSIGPTAGLSPATTPHGPGWQTCPMSTRPPDDIALPTADENPLRVLVGSPAAGDVGDPAPDGVLLLDLGDDHPSRAGLLELRLWVRPAPAGEVITRCEVVVGAMHRGVEKLYEVRDYRQILMLADRHDWQAPAAAELTIALACERLLGLEVPERARWLRTLLAEHTRLLSHLGFLATCGVAPAGRRRSRSCANGSAGSSATGPGTGCIR